MLVAFVFKFCLLFHCMNMTLFVSLFSTDGHLGDFQCGDIVSKAAVNILVQLFMWSQPPVSLAYTPGCKTYSSFPHGCTAYMPIHT